MRKVTAVALFVLLMVANGAQAQTNPSSPGNSGTQNQAPVGHRQPRAADVRDAGASTSEEEKKTKELDRELDRKLKSICRGC